MKSPKSVLPDPTKRHEDHQATWQEIKQERMHSLTEDDRNEYYKKKW